MAAAHKIAYRNLSKKYNADIFVFSANINYSTADQLILSIQAIKEKKPNCLLILTTNGGDPDASYRIVRYIRRKYTIFNLLVLGLCKSSGTLVAVGANKIIMGDFGEFGPLDIQMSKDDEMISTSGLSYFQSLIALHDRTFSSFEENFLSLKRKSIFGYSITTRTAAEIASKLAIGLIQPISEQIDPLKLGEVQRAIKIAEAYGQRILEGKKSSILSKLIGEYPSHSFVIDYQETKELFTGTNIEVLEAGEEEMEIEDLLFIFLREEGKEDIVFNAKFDEEEIKPEINPEIKENAQPPNVQEANGVPEQQLP